MPYENPFAAPAPGQPKPTPAGGVSNPFAEVPGQAIHAVNPFDAGDSPSVGGFLGNVFGEVKDIVGGVTGLIGQGVHDVIQLAHGPSSIQHPENFELWQTFKGLTGIGPGPSALLQDYKTRYGWNEFSHGDIWGGLKDLASGMYNHPLAYVGDALLAGSAVAKVGEVGILGDTASRAILGPGERSLMSMTGEGLRPFEVSKNPVARLAQNQLLDHAFSISPEKASEWLARLHPDTGSMPDLGGYIRGDEAMKLAAARDVPTGLLRPTFSRALENRWTQRALSTMGLNVRATSDAAMARTVQAIDDAKLTEEQMATMPEVLQSTVSVEAPSARPAAYSADPEFEARYPSELPPITPGKEKEGKFLEDVAPMLKKNGGRIIDPANPEAPGIMPHDTTGTVGQRVAIFSADPAVSDASTIVRKVADATGNEIVAVKNYFADTESSYEGFHATLRDPATGVLSEVSVTTPALWEEQTTWGHVAKQMMAKEAELASIDAEIAAAAGEDTSRLAAMQVALKDELDAARVVNDSTFSFTRRTQNALHDEVPYDPRLQVADRIRNIEYNYAARQEIEHGGLTYRKMLDRAFLGQRSIRWSSMMRQIEDDLVGVLRTGQTADIVPMLENYLGTGHPAILQGIRDMAREMSPEALADPVLAAKALANRVRMLTHDSIVVNGEFPTFSWKEMAAQVEADPLAVMPQYYPHLRPSQWTGDKVMTAGGTRTLEAETSRMAKDEGVLFEEGLYERDILEAYRRMYAQVARHGEFRDFLLNTKGTGVVQKYGRVPTEEELRYARYSPNGEVYISRKGIDSIIGAREQFMALKHDAMATGATAEEATKQALQSLSDAALADATVALEKGAPLDDIWAIPKHVANLIDRQAKSFLGLPKQATFFYDAAMQGWKTSVLGLSPRWIVNNTLGNLVYMGIKDPMAIRYYIDMLMPTRRAYVEAMFGDELPKEVYRDFMHGETQSLTLAQKAREAGLPGVAEKIDTAANSRLSFLTRPVRWLSGKVYKANTWNEDAARMGLAITAAQKESAVSLMGRLEGTYGTMRKIMEGGFAERGEYDSIIKSINSVLGDYLRKSPIESQIVQRYFMPFYPFYRHTAMFIARLPFENPLKARVLEQINELDQQMHPGMPEYMQGATMIAPGMYVRLGSANPLQAVTTAYSPNLTNPLLGLAIQRATGTNPFGQPWSDTGAAYGNVVEGPRGTQFEIQRNADGSFAGIAPLTHQWEPPLAKQVMNIVPQYGLITGSTLFAPKPLWQRASSFAGLSISSFNPELLALRQAQDYASALSAGARAAATEGA